jgi:hypothetical protein
MRRTAMWVLLITVGACASHDDAGQTATSTQAATAGGRLQLDFDVPLPGSEPLTPNTHGPRVEGPPLDPAYLAKQQRYLEVLAERLAAWEAAGHSAAAIEANQAALKREILGED